MGLKRRDVSVGILATLALFLIFSLTPSLPLISQIVLDGSLTGGDRLALSGNFLSSSFFDLAWQDMWYLATIAILIGLNTSLVFAYVRMRRNAMRATRLAGGFLGTLAGLLGLGCAACGTLVISPLLVTIGAGGLFVALPFGGEELKYIGIALLILSAYFLKRDLSKYAAFAV